VYGYNLQGDYQNNLAEQHLTSTQIDCSNWYGVRLKFMKWLGVESPQYDHASVRVSNDGVTWVTCWANETEVTDNSWTPVEIDISDLADNQQEVYLRWTMGTTDVGWRYCGWNIDDVQLYAIENMVTQVEGKPVSETMLLSNYPNPFRESTCILYQLTHASRITLTIYDMDGKRIITLVDQMESPGLKSVVWDGQDAKGNQVKRGIYLCQLTVGDRMHTKKMILYK
jgi:hypothetical protein